MATPYPHSPNPGRGARRRMRAVRRSRARQRSCRACADSGVVWLVCPDAGAVRMPCACRDREHHRSAGFALADAGMAMALILAVSAVLLYW